VSQLPQLRASFVDAARRQESGRVPAARRRRRSLRLSLAVAVGLLVLAAAALAATGVLRTGAPVRPSAPLTPTVGLGVPARGGSRVLHVRSADPAGGPAWGIRLVHTTRDLLCAQVGRLYHGELGVLGIDGAFHDDGGFHPLPPDTIARQPGATSCHPQGVQVSLEISGIPASGLMPERGSLGPLSRVRWVSYGLLGPDAVSVTYTYKGASHSIPVEPVTGAYLIVLPGIETGADHDDITYGGSSGISRPGAGSPLPNPAGALTAITYRFDSRTCRDTIEAHSSDPCPRPQGVPPGRRDLLHSTALHRPIHVRLHRTTGPGGYGAVLAFTAPYAVPNALSGYSIASPSPCHEGTTIDPIDRDVKRGASVTVPLEAVFANACGRSIILEVLYSPRQAQPAPGAGTVIVGRVAVKRPADAGADLQRSAR
jgi:hypothetical protein